MSNKIQVNGQNPFLKRKSPQTEINELAETEKRQLRNIQMLFQNNLYRLAKNNKDCFHGGIQIPPKVLNFNPIEVESYKKCLQNYGLYEQRLSKQMMLRNNYLQKQLKQYEQQYRSSSVTPALQNPQQSCQKEQFLNQDQSEIQCQRTWQGQTSKQKSMRLDKIKIRPFSATVAKFSDLKINLERRNIQRPSTSINIRESKRRNTMNLKNVNIDKIKLERQNRKTPLFRQSLGQIFDFQKYEEQEVYIRKKIVTSNPFPTENNFSRTTSAFYQKRTERDRLLIKTTMRSQEYYQIKNNVQKQKLQNKIMMINTVLAFNLNQTQGYKPKSKCWSNPVM